jgi:transcription antitermination factor NusG
MMTDTSWWVLHVNSNHERRVVQHLVARSVDCYLPLYTERRRWTDRAVVVQRPLFPGYVFTRFTPQERISVISTPGVLQVLGDAAHDRVSGDEIERIQSGLAGGLSLRPDAGVAIGTRVLVCNGVFAGSQGMVKELRHQCRVVLSVAGVQQFFSLEVHLDDLELLQQPVTKALLKPGLGIAC